MENLPIGIFDSGVGGLTVLNSLKEQLPDETFIYLGDTARLPYGTKSKETVISYSKHAAQFLYSQNVKMLIIACNTASSLALAELKSNYQSIPVIGVVESGAQAVNLVTDNHNILVLATQSTIDSNKYEEAILNLNPLNKVNSIACPLFVALAEEGLTEGDIPLKIAEHYLHPYISLKSRAPDAILLGCTHFPLLKNAIQSIVPDVKIVDSANSTADTVKRFLSENHLETTKSSSPTRFYVTDSVERFSNTAKFFLNSAINSDEVELVDIFKNFDVQTGREINSLPPTLSGN